MQTIVNLGTGGADLNGQNGSTTSADSNDALFLDWPGDNAGNYVYLPGVAGNYLSVPDEAALDITGDIDLRVQVAMDDWTSFVGLAHKRAGLTTDYSWSFYVNASGQLVLAVSADGVNSLDVESVSRSTAAVPVSDGQPLWVRATLDVDDGAGNHVYSYYTSSDGSSWSALGTARTIAGTTSIYVSTADVRVGEFRPATLPLPAKVYRAQILDGIGGTTVLDVDCSQLTSGGATSFTALTGQTVTINRSTSGRKSVAVVSPVWLFGTDDYVRVANNALLNFGASDDLTIITFSRHWATSPFGVIAAKESYYGAGSPGYAIYDYTESAGQPRYFMEIQDAIDNTNDIRNDVAYGTIRTLAMVRDAGTSVAYYLDGSLQLSEADATGDLTDTINFFIGSRNGTNNKNDMEFVAVALFRRALTATEIAAVTSYYQARLS